MPDVLQVLAEELAALRKRIEILEAQEDATRLSRLTVGAGADYLTVATTGRITAVGELVLNRTAATIASDTITAVGSCMNLDTEGAAASDDLKTINGGVTGRLLIINAASSARVITVKHGRGNIYLQGGADRALNHIRAVLMLIYLGSEWREIAYSRNLA